VKEVLKTPPGSRPTTLGPFHERLGARMVDFHGWWMPVQYESVLAEARAVRETAGVFDVSHMGILRFGGPRVLDALQRFFTNDASVLAPGHAQYSLMLNDAGGVIDDLIVYRDTEPGDQFLVVVNASNAEGDVAWIVDHLPSGAAMEDLSQSLDIIAVQGPEALELVRAIADGDPSNLASMSGAAMRVAGEKCFVARSGYTGEDGVEVFCAPEHSAKLFEAVLRGNGRAGARPCGLGSRDVLRMEAGLPLHGAELSPDCIPVGAGVSWALKPGKGDFIGAGPYRAALERGPSQIRRGLKLRGRRMAHPGARVLANQVAVGTITSGTFSPALGCAIAQSYLAPEASLPGTVVQVEIGEGLYDADVVRLPFIRRT